MAGAAVRAGQLFRARPVRGGAARPGARAGCSARGVVRLDAACLGLYVGGLAGQKLRDEMGSAGAIAGDLLPLIPLAMRDLRSESRPQPSAAARPDLLQMLQSAGDTQPQV